VVVGSGVVVDCGVVVLVVGSRVVVLVVGSGVVELVVGSGVVELVVAAFDESNIDYKSMRLLCQSKSGNILW
jgi:hypothetical protein